VTIVEAGGNMKTKGQLLKELYSHGHSRGLCPDWFRHMLRLIENAPE
jgi:hypothetical protein